MLTIHTTASDDPGSHSGTAFWLDLLNPTPEETVRVAAEFGIQVPSRASLQEIETSSRTYAEGQVLYTSMPLAGQSDTAGYAPLPLGFILSPQLLITIRYSELAVFAEIGARMDKAPNIDSATVFAELIDGMVDFSADVLEKLSSDLCAVSTRAFGQHAGSSSGNKRVTHALRVSLSAVGSAGDHLSRIRESLLGLQRIVGFAGDMGADWLRPELKLRLKTARQDLSSLVDFEAHLSGKTQFLLDAILGFINTEQNDIFKVLTIVSVVGIPPTLIASMYGMNFHYMPELSWRWGYAYGLALIALSTLVPIIWFKRRGWW